jgi:hypothetical protein
MHAYAQPGTETPGRRDSGAAFPQVRSELRHDAELGSTASLELAACWARLLLLLLSVHDLNFSALAFQIQVLTLVVF